MALNPNPNPNWRPRQVRAYHFGPKFLVELEIVMAEETPLRESHDVGINLQHKIERLEQARLVII